MLYYSKNKINIIVNNFVIEFFNTNLNIIKS